MIATRLLLALALMCLATASPAADPARYMSAELIAESHTPASGSSIVVGLRLVPKPGWHGYWSNPGDAGFAPTIQWSAPKGVAFGPLLHPAPKLISSAGISSYVHEGEHILLSRMTLPRGLAPGTAIPVTAKASWAACTATMCVPLNGTFTLDLTVGSGAKGPDWTALASAQRKLPKKASGGTFSTDRKSVRLLLPAALRLDPRRARFFPDDNEAFETARGRPEREGSRLVIAGPAGTDPGRSVGGVVTDGRSAYRLTFALEERTAADAKPASEATEQAAPQAAPAPPSRRSEAETLAPVPKERPEPSLWPWLMVAAAALAGSIVMARRRRKPKRF